jgi:DNA-binding protein H-NS
MITLWEQVKAERKERYRARIKRVEADLLEFGISSGLAKKLIYFYSLGVLERLIKATEKRQPGEPAAYFLNGLKKSRMKHRLQRGPIGEEDID